MIGTFVMVPHMVAALSPSLRTYVSIAMRPQDRASEDTLALSQGRVKECSCTVGREWSKSHVFIDRQI